MQVSVRLVEPGEYSLLARIGRETFYETWKDYNTPEDMQTYLLDAFDEEKIKKDLENRDVNTFLFVSAASFIASIIFKSIKPSSPLAADFF